MVFVVCLPARAPFYDSTHNSSGLKEVGVALEKQQLQCILVVAGFLVFRYKRLFQPFFFCQKAPIS